MNVSILLCIYNSNVNLLKKVIKSIDNQTYKNYEVIIINDGSSNINTLNYLDNLRKKPKYKVYDNKTNLGLIESLNIGIDKCKGEYIARFDDDDISHYNRLEKQVDFLEKNKHISALGGYAEIVDSSLNVTTTKKFPSYAYMKKYIPYRCPISHSLVMFRKKDIVKSGKYDSEYKGCEDYALWLKLIRNEYAIDNIPEILGKTKFTECDSKKRSKNMRKKLLKAKFKYLPKNKLYGIKGILFSLLWAFTPQFLVNIIYKKDIKSTIILNK